MTKANKNNRLLIISIIFLGILARFAVMQIGHNYDFDSYCIVGQLVNEGKSVYANTTRYNYGFIFFLIQGLLYKISLLFSDNIIVYRILIVSVLTLTDLLISFFIYKKKNIKTALLFFVNPVSIIISGYHNQFDNIAILLGLMTISFKKKLLYAFVPPLIFFMSFIPFALSSKESLMGIINNVFLYKSFANYPLLILILYFIPINKSLYICIFIMFMLIMSYILKNKQYSNLLYFYLIVMVACSPAIANQYLVIPVLSLFILDDSYKKYSYIFIATSILLYSSDGLKINSYLYSNLFAYNAAIFKILDKSINYGGYIIACWILLIVFYLLTKNNQNSVFKSM